MSYLIDTNVVSELRKREKANRHVRHWFSAVRDEDLFLSVLTVGELRRGVERVRRRDSAAGNSLDRWLQTLTTSYDERILPVDRAVAEEWGRLNVPDPLPVIDGLLAATAVVHGLTVVTRNTLDFGRTGAACFNPFIAG